MRFTKEDIKEINDKCPYEQGIFVEGWGIPISIKEPCIYSRYETGGMAGGNCWGDYAQPYSTSMPRDKNKVLDIILEKYFPNISLLQYRKIEGLWKNNQDTQLEYYGNCTDYMVEYIPISEFEKVVEMFDK